MTLFRFGRFVVDSANFELRRDDAIVRVERRVFNLLLYLVGNRDRLVTKDEILGHVWEGRKVSDGSLTVAMNSLRKAVDDSADVPRVIKTIRGRGYRFIAPVEEARTPDAAYRHRPATRFVGRRGELQALSAVLERARNGSGQICIVSGEAGIGKTRLCEEFCDRARRARVLAITARCLEEDGTPPFWPWIQVLRSATSISGGAQTWPKRLHSALQPLIPEVFEHSDERARSDAESTSARFRLFDATAEVVAAAARGTGLVLFIDDIHRADTASLLLLEFLAMQLNDSPVVLLLAQRDAAVQQSQFHRRTVARLMRGPRTHMIELGGLAKREIAELMHEAGALEGVNADAVLDLTGGNPLFVSQVAPFLTSEAWAARSLPVTVKDSIVRQLDGLREPAAIVLERASVIGRSFSARLVERLCVELSSISESLRESEVARLIERLGTGDTFRFRHALVREVLYERVELVERARMHWLVADAIEAIHGVEAEEFCSEIAFHRFSGSTYGEPLRAISACRRAGLIASAQLAYEEAATQFQRALELAEVVVPRDSELQCDLLLALGREQTRSGDRDLAAATLARAAALAREMGDGTRLAAAALASSPGLFSVEAGAPDEFVIALLREAIASCGVGDDRVRARLMARLAMALAWCDSADEKAWLIADASRIASARRDSQLELHVLVAQWFAEWQPAEFERRWSIADRLIVQSGSDGDPETSLLCRLFHVTCLLERGEIKEFKRQVALFTEAADSLRQPEAIWYSTLLRAMLALHLGELDEADRCSRQFAQLGEMVRDANVFHSRTSHRVLLAWESGDLDEMVNAASAGCDAFPAMYGWHSARAWALARAGRVIEAQREIDFLVRNGVDAIPRTMDWPVTMAILGETAVLLGDPDLSEAVFRELGCLRGRTIVLGLCVATWGCASRYLGRLASVRGEWNLSEQLLREAVEVDTRAEAKAWAAWSMYELGRVLMNHPDASPSARREGMRWISRARREARRMNMRWLSTEATKC